MERRRKLLIAGAAAVVGVAVTGGIAVASNADDDDATETPITGRDLERASAAALDHTGGGRVTATELEDEESRYEVEVTLEDGSQVDVQLDESFAVVNDESDDDGDESDDDGDEGGAED